MVVSHTIHMYIFSYLFWAKSCNFHSVNLENRVCEKNSWNLDVAYLSLQFNYGLNFHKKFCFLTKGVEKERPNCFKIASDCTISIYYSHFWPGKARGPPPPLRKGVSPSAPTLTALASALGLLLGVLHDTSVHTCSPHPPRHRVLMHVFFTDVPPDQINCYPTQPGLDRKGQGSWKDTLQTLTVDFEAYSPRNSRLSRLPPIYLFIKEGIAIHLPIYLWGGCHLSNDYFWIWEGRLMYLGGDGHVLNYLFEREWLPIYPFIWKGLAAFGKEW